MGLFKRGFSFALAAALATAAGAQTWTGGTMHSQGEATFGIIGLHFHTGGDGANGSYYAGLLKFNENHGSGLGDIETICADLYHDYHNNDTWGDRGFAPASTFVTTDPGDYATKNFFDTNSLTTAGNIVSWGFSHFSDGSLSADDLGAGLQIATWAALYTDASAGSLSFAGNAITVGIAGHLVDITSVSAGAQTAANYFWASRNLAGNSTFIEKTSFPPGQDMLTSGGTGHHFVTPEPFTTTLGFAAVGLFLRRRTRKS